MSTRKTPVRGDVFFANFNNVVGSEQAGRRPVLVIQNDMGNRFSNTVIVAIITSKPKRNMPTHIILDNPQILSCRSVICTEQIKTIDKSRLDSYKGNVGDEVMEKVEEAIAISVGMKNYNQISLFETPETMATKGGERQMRMETDLDYSSNNWLEYINTSLKIFANIEQYLINLRLDKAELDQEIEDILIFIEGTSYNTVQGYKVYRILRERQNIRMQKMREISTIETMLNELNCEQMRRAFSSCLTKMKTENINIGPSKAVKELLEMVG